MEDIITLINQAQAGDSEAYGVIVSRFQNMAYGYAYAILNDFHLAQDAAQEAFIEAYLCLPTLREALAFPAWFKRIVFKQCDRLTRGKRHAIAPLETIADMASPLPGPSDVAEQRELTQRVQNAIRELPEDQRMVTTLFYISGYSHQEIADFLEVPAKTVKSRLHASRSRLRERIIDMVEDEFKANALPDNFTQETVEKAVAQAAELNRDSKHDQAEDLMRKILAQVPQHPGALKELNRALAQGRVYPQGRFDLLPELAEQGKIILQANDDEYINQQLAKTLLTIPVIPEAIAFIEDWIARKGANIERLGMLAWAKGCIADYASAEAIWQDLLSLTQTSERDEISQISFIAYILVDCLSEAGELQRAQRVARQAWECYISLGITKPDTNWLTIFFQAKLDLHEVANALLAQYQDNQTMVLGIRSWVDDPQTVAADWLDWVRECIAAGEWRRPRDFYWDSSMNRGFWTRGEWRALSQLAQATWELLEQANTKEAREQFEFWDCQRFNTMTMGAIEAKDWAAAEKSAHREIEESGMGAGGWYFVYIAAIRGLPTPPDVVQYVEQKDMDKYDLIDWYVVAREAAAAGDEAKAFDALRKALSYWTNPPYNHANIWEADTYWGELRNHPEFKAAFDERRRRIGPIHGQLHYFPGW